MILMQENALVLLQKRFRNPEWDKVMGTYWESLPQRGSVITKETFPPTKLGVLQDPAMVNTPLLLAQQGKQLPIKLQECKVVSCAWGSETACLTS